MKRSLVILSFLFLSLSISGRAVGQVAGSRDSSSTNLKNRRAVISPDDPRIESTRHLAEHARAQAEATMRSIDVKSLVQSSVEASMAALNAQLPQAMAQIGPAMEQAMQALEFSMQELENVDWAEVNAALQDLPDKLPRRMPLVHIPPLPPLPPIPAPAPMAPFPPLPQIPPIPDIPPPSLYGEDLYWHWDVQEYAENLTDDEQIKIQALGALLSQDEKTAVPEIKRLGLEHPNWAMRAAAVSLLGCSDRKEALPILDEVLNKDTDHRVRLAAVRVLSNRPEPEAREILKRLLLK